MIRTRYRTFSRRFWAGFVDAIVLLPIAILGKYMWSHHASIPTAVFILWYISQTAAYRLYDVLLHGIYGQTIGKRVMGVVVINQDEKQPMTIAQAIRRDIYPVIMAIIGIIIFIPRVLRGGYPTTPPTYTTMDWVRSYSFYGWFLMEFITMLFNSRRRALHDYIAGTVVVRKESLTR
jgi:uncharacterized RDD family membrane protein YckC